MEGKCLGIKKVWRKKQRWITSMDSLSIKKRICFQTFSKAMWRTWDPLSSCGMIQETRCRVYQYAEGDLCSLSTTGVCKEDWDAELSVPKERNKKWDPGSIVYHTTKTAVCQGQICVVRIYMSSFPGSQWSSLRTSWCLSTLLKTSSWLKCSAQANSRMTTC